jgi:hypothetical protein
VGKLSEWSRWVWLEAELALVSLMPPAVAYQIYAAKEITKLLIRPYLTIYQLQGQTQGGLLTMTFAGRRHTKARLKSRIFVEEPVENEVGRVPFWHLERLADSTGDIVIVEATKYLIHRLPCHNAIFLPRLLHHTVDVRGDWHDVRRRFRKTVRKNELRWIRKYGYKYDISRDGKDFEVFYRHMYLPTMDDRHGELSVPMSIGEAFQHFRHGCLVRVTRDGDWVSGVVCHSRRKVLIADILGVKDGGEELVQQGATAATYYAAIHWANQHGYDGVNFLGSPPFLESGNFQHKRKWGATVSIPLDVHGRIWIGVRRCTSAVSRFLMGTPFVVIDDDGRLHGLIVVDDPHHVSAETRKGWEARYVTPGLSTLLIRSASDLAEEVADIDDPALVIPVCASATR